MGSTAPPKNLTFVFVPGAWHRETSFHDLCHKLNEDGHSTKIVPLCSVGAEPPKPSLNEDVERLGATLDELAEDSRAIVLVLHSYSGVVGSNATKNRGFNQRAKAGLKGGVVMIIYIAAFALPRGKCLLDMLGNMYLPWMDVKGEYCYASNPAEIFYNDLAKAKQDECIAQLTHSSTSVFSQPATNEPWHDIPCTYILCKKDNAIPLPVQEAMVATMGDVYRVSIEASHSPFLSMPETVAVALQLAADIGLLATQLAQK